MSAPSSIATDPGRVQVLRRGQGPLRVAVLGAGPIGLEAALYGAALGHDVTVYERGELGQSVAQWRHVRMFSPWRMNVTPLGLSELRRSPPEREARRGDPLRDPERCPTGAEFLDEYLLPLSRSPLLRGRVRTRSRVIAIGREGVHKGDTTGRAEAPFRLLIDDLAGEHVAHADVVLDCTGTYSTPNPLGAGGILAPGERWLGERLLRHLPDVLGRDRARFARRRVLLVGAGQSAATCAPALLELCKSEPGTEVVWASRRPEAQPYTLYPSDPFPERDLVLRSANHVAAQGSSGDEARPFRFFAGAGVDSLRAEGHRLRVTLRESAGERVVLDELFDEVIGLCGYGPDRELYRELQVHECYASLGPMKLAAALVASGADGDCTAQPLLGFESLRTPEPDFYILGSKSYGRTSTFMLPVGHAQIRTVFGALPGAQAIDPDQAA